MRWDLLTKVVVLMFSTIACHLLGLFPSSCEKLACDLWCLVQFPSVWCVLVWLLLSNLESSCLKTKFVHYPNLHPGPWMIHKQHLYRYKQVPDLFWVWLIWRGPQGIQESTFGGPTHDANDLCFVVRKYLFQGYTL